MNNAGIGIFGPLELVPLAQFRRQLDVNLTGQLAVTQAFLPLLRRRLTRQPAPASKVTRPAPEPAGSLS